MTRGALCGSDDEVFHSDFHGRPGDISCDGAYDDSYDEFVCISGGAGRPAFQTLGFLHCFPHPTPPLVCATVFESHDVSFA